LHTWRMGSLWVCRCRDEPAIQRGKGQVKVWGHSHPKAISTAVKRCQNAYPVLCADWDNFNQWATPGLKDLRVSKHATSGGTWHLKRHASDTYTACRDVEVTYVVMSRSGAELQESSRHGLCVVV